MNEYNERRECVFLTDLYLMKAFTILTIMEYPKKGDLKTIIMSHQNSKTYRTPFLKTVLTYFPMVFRKNISDGEIVEDYNSGTLFDEYLKKS